MSGTNDGLGWVPVEAREELEREGDRASAEEAERLLALDPRTRVLALLELAGRHGAEEARAEVLRPADLARVLESFPGAAPITAEELAAHLPALFSQGS